MTTLPGLLLVDFYDVAVYGELGGDDWQTVSDRLEEPPAAIFLFVSALAGFLLALPLAAAGRVAGTLSTLVARAGDCSRRDLRTGGTQWLRALALGARAGRSAMPSFA